MADSMHAIQQDGSLPTGCNGVDSFQIVSMPGDDIDSDQHSSDEHDNNTCECGLFHLLPPEIW